MLQNQQQISAEALMQADPDTYEDCLIYLYNNDTPFFNKVKHIINRMPDNSYCQDLLSIPKNFIIDALLTLKNLLSISSKNILITPEMFQAQTKTILLVTKNVNYTEEETAIALEEFTRIQNTISLDMATSIITGTLETWLFKQKERIAIDNMSIGNVPDNFDLGTALSDIKEFVSIKDKKKEISLFSECFSSLEEMPERIEFGTHLQNFARILGGGIARTEHVLFVIPSGAGKTVLTTQLAYELALKGRKVLVLETEETSMALNIRIASNALDLPYEIIRDGFDLNKKVVANAAYQGLASKYFDREDIRDKAAQTASILDKYCRIHSLTNYEGTLNVKTDLRRFILEAGDALGGIDIVILDWLGKAIGPASPIPEAMRIAYSAAANCLTGLAVELNFGAFTMVQTNDEGLKSKHILSQHIGESKTIIQTACAVFGISGFQVFKNNKPTPSMLQNVTNIKNRRNEQESFIIKRDFRFQRFIQPAIGETT